MFFVPTQFYYPYNTMKTYNAIYSEQSQRVRFTKEEDELLKQLVNNQSQPNWNEISRYMKSRTARQCRERYNNYLRPNLINGPWTREEDDLLIELYEKYGPKWSYISHSFNSRSPVNLKNHHSSLISKMIIKNRQNKVELVHEDITKPDKEIEVSTQSESNTTSTTPSTPETPLTPTTNNEKVEKNSSQEKNSDQSGENMFPNHQFEDEELWTFSFMSKIDENLLAF